LICILIAKPPQAALIDATHRAAPHRAASHRASTQRNVFNQPATHVGGG